MLGRGPEPDRAGDRPGRRPGDALTAPGRIRAVLFDAGRTLLEPDPPAERVYAQAFARSGLDVPEGRVLAAIESAWREVREREARGGGRWGGPGGEEGFWRRFAGGVYASLGGAELSDDSFLELRAHFARPVAWKVYPEVPGVLESLRSRGFALGVVSNWDSSLPGLLERVSLARWFGAIVASAAFGAGKPSPAIFAEALSRLGVAAAEALHVGDSLEEDYHAARAAGLSAVWLDRTGLGPGAGSGRDGVPTAFTLADLERFL